METLVGTHLSDAVRWVFWDCPVVTEWVTHRQHILPSLSLFEL